MSKGINKERESQEKQQRSGVALVCADEVASLPRVLGWSGWLGIDERGGRSRAVRE
jgi:hypothetical protein